MSKFVKFRVEKEKNLRVEEEKKGEEKGWVFGIVKSTDRGFFEDVFVCCVVLDQIPRGF